MKKGLALFIVTCSLAAIITPSVLVFTSNKETKAEKSDTYYLTFSKTSNHHEYEYSIFSKTITAKNYNNDDITFKYNRMVTNNDGFAVMKPGSEFYNPFIGSSSNYNALDGLKSVCVTYNESTYGDLYLSYGIDESYMSKNILLESGQTYTFDSSYRPSHFKLVASPDEILDKYQIFVTSIELTYSSYEYYVEGEEQYNVYSLKDNCGKAIIASNDETSFDMGNVNIASNNYFIIKYHANGYLKGKINYVETGTSTSYSEEFFITPDQEEFRTFLDAFRKGAGGNFNKTITSISFSNPNDTAVTIYLNKVSYADRTFSRTDVKSLSDGNIKLDISLKHGGSVTGVYDLSHNTIEYYNNSGEIKIRSSNDIGETIKKTVATNPNLVNCHDLGREIQQSYYFNVDEENGYTPGQYGGKDNQYNPVQAGDNSQYESKIVDYFATNTKIWVKVQAADWAKTNSLTKSYMTNTYEIKNHLIYVNNTFVNWYNFVNYKNNLPSGTYGPATAGAKYWATQELPAIYVNHPLNYYSSVYNGYELYDKNQGWNVGTTAVESSSESFILNSDGKTYRSSRDANTYHYSFRKHASDWLAYLNEDKFGLGVYMPAQKFNTDSFAYRHVFMSGNYKTDHTYDSAENRNYLNDNYEKVTVSKYSYINNPIPSYKVNNTNYLSTVLGFYPSEFTTISWTYAIGVDYIDTLKAKFKTIQDSGEIYNDFTIWKGATI